MDQSEISIHGSQDIVLLRNLAERSFLPTYLPFISEAQVMYMFERMYSEVSLWEQIEARGHHFFVARKGDIPAGFASVQPDAENGGRAKLHKLYVLPEFQGAAIGYALMREAEHFAQESGQSHLFLNVNRSNNAVAFYKRQGYEIYLEEDIDIGNGYFMNDYRMQKSLAAK